MTLRVHLLGEFRVLVDARPVGTESWRSRRAAEIVQLLALAPHHRLHREQIIEALWPDHDVEAQTNNLNVAVTRARGALVLAGAQAGVYLTRNGEQLVLGPPGIVWVDVDTFEIAAARARASQDMETIESALATYTGDLLDEYPYEAWTTTRRSELRGEYIALLRRLGYLRVSRGEPEAAVEAFERLMRLDPASEETAVALMRLYAAWGQRTLALQHFQQLGAAMQRDLDASPTPSTVTLAAAIRDGRFSVSRAGEPTSDARTAAPENLPRPVDELISREREIAEVRDLLGASRLVTLTGTGGIGKTRLAIAVAQASAGDFPDGVAFVDLTSIRDAGLVVTAIAQALGVRDQGDRNEVKELALALRERAILLVLDNFEHVVESAPHLTTLLERTRRLRIMVTSRMSLRIEHEQEYLVPPLRVPPERYLPDDPQDGAPAVTLFVRRARKIDPHFALTYDNAPAIFEICRRLDGLPLAIELAAARLKVLTPSSMLARLDQPLSLLAGERRDLPERQRTMRQTIAWSHDLLSPPEQRLLRRLSVFVGGWTLDAAESVVDPDGDLGFDILSGLSSLVEKNLVARRETNIGVRFSMLEVIREFALEQFTGGGDADRVQNAHAAWFVEVAERTRPYIESRDQAFWLNQLRQDDGNFRATLDWLCEHEESELALRLVVALQLYWFVRGRIVEGCDQSLRVVALEASRAVPAARAEALAGIALMARDGTVALARQVSEESLAIARDIGNRKCEADALVNLAYIAWGEEETAEAERLVTECLGINRELGNAQGIADAVSVLGIIAHKKGDDDIARRLIEESLAIWESLEDVQGVVWARTRLVPVLIAQGLLTEALKALESSLTIAEELEFTWGRSWVLDGGALLAGALGAWRLAASLADAAATMRAEAGLTPSRAEQGDIDRLRQRIAASTGPDAAVTTTSPSSGIPAELLMASLRDLLCGETVERPPRRAS